MNPKIRREHLERGAIVYVRQSTATQVSEHVESRRRQYALADTAQPSRPSCMTWRSVCAGWDTAPPT